MTADLARKPILKGIEHHLYVIEVPSGVKVGISGAPRARLREHRRQARTYGFEIGRTWVSGPHTEARSNEQALIALGGPDNRREYIAVDFDSAVAAAEKLPKSRASCEARSRNEAAKRSRVSFLWPAGTTQQDVVRTVSEIFG